ncbi:MAG: GNAT family N-acetyltransferase [Chloroflexota bacterium]
MPQHHTYTPTTLPAHLAHQRMAFVRMLWIDHYVGNPDYTLTPDPRTLHHEMYVQQDALVSSVSVINTDIILGAESFVCYGIAAVMTFPFWRGQGYAGDLMDRANAFIRAQDDADVGLLWTGVAPFYAQRGWETLPGEPAVFGDPANPTVRGGETTMMLFVSEKAVAARPQLEAGPFYVGQTTW